MSESSLSISYTDLLAEVGGFLGYGSDYSKWDAIRYAEVDRYIQSGLRQFYYPPAVQGVEAGYSWSFLSPIATIDTVADTKIQDLPDDFGHLSGNSFNFESSVFSAPVVLVSMGQMMAFNSTSDDSSVPKFATIYRKDEDLTIGQRFQVEWWPTPNDAYTLTYKYQAYSGKISETEPYPLGGMKYSELILESCLAIAEQRANDEGGLHSQRFISLLASGIAMDRQSGAKFYGQMGCSGVDDFSVARRNFGDNYPVTYKGVTW